MGSIKIVGQRALLAQLETHKERFPSFTIIEANDKEQAQEVIRYISTMLEVPIFASGSRVDDVREVIESAYEQQSPIMYTFIDGEKMSPSAKASMLKVTEEPPNNARFILVVDLLTKVLPTLISRAQVFRFTPYTNDELVLYADVKIDLKYSKQVVEYCETPSDIDILANCDVKKFMDAVKLISTGIGKSTLGNALKIGAYAKLTKKDDDADDKFDLMLLLRAIKSWMIDEALAGGTTNIKPAIDITNKAIDDLKLTGAVKKMIFTNWIIATWQALEGN